MKWVLGVYSPPEQHWVGDDFPVHSLFSYNSHGEHLSPFLLLDYAGAMKLEPTERPRGRPGLSRPDGFLRGSVQAACGPDRCMGGIQQRETHVVYQKAQNAGNVH